MASQRPTRDTVAGEVDRVVRESLGIELAKEAGAANMDRFDSIDILDSVAALEQHFDVDFERQDLARIRSPRDLYVLVYRKHVIEKIPADPARFADSVFVVPAYNHARRLGRVLESAAGFGRPIIVVDDGSTDDTYRIASEHESVEVIRHKTNLGKGAALTTGFRAASQRARWAIAIDADGQHEPAEATDMLMSIPEGSRPIVVGRRWGMEGRNVPWTSRMGREFSNFWVRLAGGGRIHDSQSGFRVYPLPEILDLNARARRFQYEVEILALAAWHGIDVIEVPISVNYPPGGERISHFRPFVDFCRNASTFSRLIVSRLLLPRALRVRLSTRGSN